MDGLSADDFLGIQRVNVVGPFQMTRACRPYLREAASGGRGAVVNVSSVAGTHGFGSSLAYVASKGGLNSMTVALARALGPEGIRVNAVCPGFIEGAWLRKGLGDEVYNGIKAHLEKSTPLRSVQTPEIVARTIVLLLEAPNVTGETLVIDAGMRLTVA
jgi:3-oxoacyl-[acyl-carrier protein] reductase